ncbi:hypothetical protein CXQ85_005272 [Candidozyma haemuli]|uniref:Uncharacterized protein n=1 Tax=Candidozyma haemuli TaxID=45357 RepID=A0A2V1AXW6_9ASCO|nr:hypothetical protein CXQ85_005272 [[Candida] haemuloni]PVH22698.1 hypothetical protein CXQ85_005272 [[Candida] haemuloni]
MAALIAGARSSNASDEEASTGQTSQTNSINTNPYEDESPAPPLSGYNDDGSLREQLFEFRDAVERCNRLCNTSYVCKLNAQNGLTLYNRKNENTVSEREKKQTCLGRCVVSISQQTFGVIVDPRLSDNLGPDEEDINEDSVRRRGEYLHDYENSAEYLEVKEMMEAEQLANPVPDEPVDVSQQRRLVPFADWLEMRSISKD